MVEGLSFVLFTRLTILFEDTRPGRGKYGATVTVTEGVGITGYFIFTG